MGADIKHNGRREQMAHSMGRMAVACDVMDTIKTLVENKELLGAMEKAANRAKEGKVAISEEAANVIVPAFTTFLRALMRNCSAVMEVGKDDQKTIIAAEFPHLSDEDQFVIQFYAQEVKTRDEALAMPFTMRVHLGGPDDIPDMNDKDSRVLS